MTTFQDLIITGNDLKRFIDNFEKYITDNFEEKWQIETHDDVFFIENPYKNATVCLVFQDYKSRKKIEVTNVVPTNGHALTVQKYNEVLTLFNDEVLQEYKKEKNLNIQIEKTSGEMTLSDIFGKIGEQLLRKYCNDAKNLSIENIKDYSSITPEWYKFIIYTFNSGYMCHNTGELSSYLNELLENEEKSNFLALEYTRTITFLSYYEGEFKVNKGRE